jgi:hypothetical protein
MMRVNTDEEKGRLGETRLYTKYFVAPNMWIAENLLAM